MFPNGKSETIFKAKWDFNWQVGYDLEKPIALPKGTRIVGIAHYDQQTGRYATPDGRVYEQQDLTPAAAHRDWRDLIFSGGSP